LALNLILYECIYKVIVSVTNTHQLFLININWYSLFSNTIFGIENPLI
jgi:hypothetical protein